MKNILFLLLCLSLFACSKSTLSDNDEEATPLGEWQGEYFSDDPEFKKTYVDLPDGDMFVKFIANDSCQHGFIDSKHNKYVWSKSFCEITNETIIVKGGEFIAEFGTVKNGTVIYIYSLTKDQMILQTDIEHIKNPYPELKSTYCYCKLKRIK